MALSYVIVSETSLEFRRMAGGGGGGGGGGAPCMQKNCVSLNDHNYRDHPDVKMSQIIS